ncbi:MAG: YidH family protein [Candidatus Baltobacteraceae bacterium]
MGSAADHLANERTFLAYVRTALAFIGFGFVIARFAVFMREFASLQRHGITPPGVSVTFGVIMVFMGVIVGGFGAFRYITQLQALGTGRADPLSKSAAIVVASVIAVFGLIMAYVLFQV